MHFITTLLFHIPTGIVHRDLIVTDNAIDKFVRIVFILLSAFFLVKLVTFTMDKSKKLAEAKLFTQTGRSNQKRMDTVYNTLKNVINVTLFSVAVVFILGEFGINLAPLVAGASFLGVALGFGAQTLVKDMLYGFFILAENQFGLGDIVQIGDYSGTVESMNLRSVSLRDQSGRVHIIPNGEASKVTVFTQGWSAMSLDIYLPYESNLDAVFHCIDDLNQSFFKANQSLLLDPPQNLGLEDFTDKGLKLTIIAKTQPQQQWQITRLYRKALKQAFEKNNLKLAITSPGYIQV